MAGIYIIFWLIAVVAFYVFVMRAKKKYFVGVAVAAGMVSVIATLVSVLTLATLVATPPLFIVAAFVSTIALIYAVIAIPGNNNEVYGAVFYVLLMVISAGLVYYPLLF